MRLTETRVRQHGLRVDVPHDNRPQPRFMLEDEDPADDESTLDELFDAEEEEEDEDLFGEPPGSDVNDAADDDW